MLGMKVQATKLLKLFTSINFLLRLIMKLIAPRKTVVVGFATEAHHNPEILGKLSKNVRGQLVKLHPKLQQDIN
jgi:hypothetical protein